MKTYFLAAVIMAAPLRAGAATPESAPVVALDAALLATMKSGSAGAGFQARYDALDPVVKQSLNLPVILQNSVGFLWSTIPGDQQARLAVLFEQFTVASYVNGFASYGGEKLELLPAERDVGASKVVETQIVPVGGSPVRLDYVMADGPGGWQATDVLENATISKVAVQASDFSALVNAGDATQLIAALKSKVAALSDNALSN